MASDRYFFSPAVLCSLCGTTIEPIKAQPSYGREQWKGYAQELTLSQNTSGTAELVEPSICSMTFQGEPRAVHSACWNVLAGVAGRREFSAAWLDGFLDCSRDIGPFLPQIAYQPAPDQLDIDLCDELTDIELTRAGEPRTVQTGAVDLTSTLEAEGIEVPKLCEIADHEFPEDIENHLSFGLKTGFDQVLQSNPQLTFWIILANMLLECKAFSKYSEHEVPGKLAKALRNLKQGGVHRFPRTANYDVVRNNARVILRKLSTIPVEEVFTAEPLNGMRPKLEKPRTVPLTAIGIIPFMRLEFYTLRRSYYVDNGNDRCMKVGAKYIRSITFSTENAGQDSTSVTLDISMLCGIRMVRDRLGAIAVHIKGEDGWEYGWQQDPDVQLRQDQLQIRPSQAEWHRGFQQGSFLIVSDTFKDQWVFDQVSDYVRATGL